MTDMTLDFETYYGTGYSLRLNKYSIDTYVRDPQFKIHMCGFQIDDEPPFVLEGKEMEEFIRDWRWNETRLICQNTPFDGFILHDKFDVHADTYVCTLALNRAILQGEIRNSLEEMSPRWGVGHKGKELAEAFNVRNLREVEGLYEKIEGYCEGDVRLTRAIALKQLAIWPEKEQKILDMTLKQWCVPRLYIDVPRLQTELKRVVDNRDEIVKRTGYAASNFSSTAKFKNLLEKKGVVVPTKYSEKQKKEVPAFAKDDLAWIQLQDQWERDGNTELLNLAAARTECASSIHITRPQRLIDLSAGGKPIGAPYKYWGAHTGRFSGADKKNFQNFKRGGEIRKCIMAPEGYVLVVRDLSQIELRMNAFTAEENWMLDDLRNGTCVYSRTAGGIYHDPEEVWRMYKAMGDPDLKRFVGKTTELGLGYGMGWWKFQLTLATGAMGPRVVLDDDRCKEIVYDIYRPTHAKIVEQWAVLEAMAMQMLDENCDLDYKGIIRFGYQHIKLPNGTYLYYPHLKYDEEAQSLMYWDAEKRYWKNLYGGLIAENVIQALSRIVMTDSSVEIDKEYPIVLHTHDELVALAPEAEAERCEALMDSLMTTPPAWCAGIPLEAEGGYDYCYSK